MRRLIAALSAMLLCGWAARGQEGHHHELSEEEVGSVHFETTCGAGMSEAAKTEFDAKFNKAVALLHSFQYEDTRAAFEKIAGENPQCAMAEWGVALSLKLSASPLDKTFSNEKKCGEILEPIFKKQPHHPGVAHYIIHCYDNPALAQDGLGAARMYG